MRKGGRTELVPVRLADARAGDANQHQCRDDPTRYGDQPASGRLPGVAGRSIMAVPCKHLRRCVVGMRVRRPAGLADAAREDRLHEHGATTVDRRLGLLLCACRALNPG